MSFYIAMGARERKSPYFKSTVKAGVTHFTVYNHMYMPVSYGDMLAEYNRLIYDVAIWDVAAERQVQIIGPDAKKFIQYLTPRSLNKFSIGQGKYVPICDHLGNLINDPIAMKLDENKYWLSIADQDLLYVARAIAAEKGFDVDVDEPDVSPLAVQGPKAEDLIVDLFGEHVRDINYFWFRETELDGIPLVLMRSGWSKQGGFELFLQDSQYGDVLWDKVVAAGQKYNIGPGAPNYIERIESGLLSFGADNFPDCDPFEVGLGKLVNLEREDDFVGKAALQKRFNTGVRRSLTGLVLDGEPIQPNAHPWGVYAGEKRIGKISAVAYSPRLEMNIAIALIDSNYTDIGTELTVDDDAEFYKAVVHELPFGKRWRSTNPTESTT
ncbi:glycine cleavage T C-terminal barrel domain-containing protein [Ostreibacterium oceani]|uniref:Glycine cleavage system protein T n=1 Tax=Ostreibacterium oceani TaxID=2654998 RepID=A0A6N7EYB7_9GAMM|nr:glycine cleavage T C-terminal barrel domain-containing protein [Ostreibacterium oceani]MPV86943.1 glycine cleavage system protein T [Ostreibacterium oceani]